MILENYVVAGQLLSCVQLFAIPRTTAHQSSLSFTISWSLLKLMSIKSVRSSNHLILCHPLLLLPSIFPSIRVFSNESALCIRWSKYWSFSFSIYPSNEYSDLISFIIDWFDFLAVQGTLKSLLQHHSLKSRDVILPTKVHVCKAMDFLVVMYRCESGTIKKAEQQRDSQESFPATQFKSINSLVFSVLCWQSGLCFLICCLVCHSFCSKEKIN